MKSMKLKYVLAAFFCFPVLPAMAGAVCPEPVQPELGKSLRAMLADRGFYPVMECIHSIQDALESTGESESMPDEVRYELASRMSDAMKGHYEQANPSTEVQRYAAQLWSNYLDRLSPPVDAVRVRFATMKLMQHGRNADFPSWLPSILKGVGLARSVLNPELGNTLFSTLKRCPAFGVESIKLSCSETCVDLADQALAQLKVELGGPFPWTGNAGLVRMGTNAQALEKERNACLSVD